MSDDATMLYLDVIMYDVFEDSIFEALIPVNNVTLDFYNNDFKGCNDMKAISFKGKLRNNLEGSILLGSL